MTTLTLEEQRKLAEKVWPHCEWKITRSGLINENNPEFANCWCPNFGEDEYERSQALAVLEAYAKSAIKYDNMPRRARADFTDKAVEILEALRTGNLDPIARELIK